MTSDRVTLRTPTDLLAAVPYLLGFHPTDSVVAVGLRGSRVAFSARADLPGSDGGPAEAEALAAQLAEVLVGQAVSAAFVVGYGPAARVTRAVLPVRAGLAGHGVAVLEVLRVTAGRYWSYLCTSPRCCPDEGTPYEPASTEVAAAATYAGRLVLPDRAALAASVGAPTGRRLAAIEAETDAQAARLDALVPAARHRAGAAAVRSALLGRRAGTPLGDAEVARLSLLLRSDRVRDVAWRAVARSADTEPQVCRWHEVTRRVRPDLAAAPATLLAFAAWRSGAGALAWVAVERALAQQPGYPAALLIGEVLARAVPPALLTPVGLDRRRARGGVGWARDDPG